MLIVALVLAVIGLAALVTAVVSSNEIVAWVCIAASSFGVVLLVVDAVRERQRRVASDAGGAGTATEAIDVSDGDEQPGPVSEQQAEIETEAVISDAGSADQSAEVVTEVVTEAVTEVVMEDHPEEVVHDEPEFDTYSDDESEYPPPAEESALHTIDESDPADGEPEVR